MSHVYLHFNDDDRLLYVGITQRELKRQYEHARTKPWWPDVKRIAVMHTPDITAARELERSLIEVFRPIYNVQHNRIVMDLGLNRENQQHSLERRSYVRRMAGQLLKLGSRFPRQEFELHRTEALERLAIRTDRLRDENRRATDREDSLSAGDLVEIAVANMALLAKDAIA